MKKLTDFLESNSLALTLNIIKSIQVGKDTASTNTFKLTLNHEQPYTECRYALEQAGFILLATSHEETLSLCFEKLFEPNALIVERMDDMFPYTIAEIKLPDYTQEELEEISIYLLNSSL